jgi:uncharacterized protein (DUF1800 family)
MTAQEFAKWMPASSLVATIASAWNIYDVNDNAVDETVYVMRTCWEQLLQLRDPIDALEMVAAEIGDTSDFMDFVEVVG